MDGLGAAANIAAVVDLSAKVAILCFQYSAAVASARADISRLHRHVNSLGVALRGAKRLIEGPSRQRLDISLDLADTIRICTDELQKLQHKLGSGAEPEPMRRFGLRALKWPFSSKEIEGIIGHLESYERTILLGLQIDQTSLLLSINDRIESMQHQGASDTAVTRSSNFLTYSYDKLLLPEAGLASPHQLALPPSQIPVVIHGNNSDGTRLVGLHDVEFNPVSGQLQRRTKAIEGTQLSSPRPGLRDEAHNGHNGQPQSKRAIALHTVTMLSDSYRTTRYSASIRADDLDGVFDDARAYYTSEARHINRAAARCRTHSQNNLTKQLKRIGRKEGFRRSSHEEFDSSNYTRKFLIDVESTLESLQRSEDTNSDVQITIHDGGPKVLHLRTAASSGYKGYNIQGNYVLSNLSQELTLAKEYGRRSIILDVARLNENPVARLLRLIRGHCWDGLTRQIHASTIETSTLDPKDWTDDPRPRIYVPVGAPAQFEFYRHLAMDRPEMRLDVQLLPEKITSQLARDLNRKPGLLALAMETVEDPKTDEGVLRGLPFVVPESRLHELRGCDSYMAVLGLLTYDSRAHLAKSIVLNLAFCIQHYGMVPNAIRSYRLCQSQPPFLTDMTLRVYDKLKHEPDAKEFLRTAMLAAIKEYHNIWTSEPRLDPTTGLSRYRPEGLGIPPDTDISDFTHIIEPHARQYRMTCPQFARAYNEEEVTVPELDEYFTHHRAMLESGEFSSKRFGSTCADLATIDLNSLLFKYETDIARTIRNKFDDRLIIPDEFSDKIFPPGFVVTSALWDRRARRRKLAINKYLWNEAESMYFDYDTVKRKQTTFESVTAFWALWAGVATPKQAAQLVSKSLPKFEAVGGLASSTPTSREQGARHQPDSNHHGYPWGGASHQMMTWTGLLRYLFTDEAERLAYKWLFLITKTFVDHDGVVAEKYDVTHPADDGQRELFACDDSRPKPNLHSIAKHGYAAVNASYVYGLQIVNMHMRRAIGTLTPHETFAKALEEKMLGELAE